jgi:alanine racemase
LTRPIRATLDLSALRGNFAVARQHAGEARLWAVIKANAYGHGLMSTAEALDDLADGYALLDLDDAVALREAGYRQPILLLEGFFEADELPLLAEYGLTPVVHTLEQIEMLTGAALPARLPVYLKINTGMNRLGLSLESFHAALTALETLPSVASVTLMTHFADADLERGIGWQMARFVESVQGCGHPVSLANSAALLRFPEVRRGWARPGIMLYGSSPFPQDESAEQLGLRPVMTPCRTCRGVTVSATAVCFPLKSRCASASSPAVTPTATRAMRRRARRSSSRATARAPLAASRWT